MATCGNGDHSKNTESKDGSGLPKMRRIRVVLWDESPEDNLQEDDDENKKTSSEERRP